MDKKRLMSVLMMFLLVFSSFSVSAQPTEDCSWLCQLVNFFQGEEGVVGALMG